MKRLCDFTSSSVRSFDELARSFAQFVQLHLLAPSKKKLSAPLWHIALLVLCLTGSAAANSAAGGLATLDTAVGGKLLLASVPLPEGTSLAGTGAAGARQANGGNPLNFGIQGKKLASSNADLVELETFPGSLTPAFAVATTAYSVNVPSVTANAGITVRCADLSGTVQTQLNGGGFGAPGACSGFRSFVLNVGANTIDVRVSAPDALTIKTYTLTITRAALSPGEPTPLDAKLLGTNVSATALQPDGKIIVAGSFNSVMGVAGRNNIARLNADGTLDLAFNPNPNSYVSSIAIQADGKVLLAGDFTTLQPNGATLATTRNRIARVNADGSLDLDFNPNADKPVYSVTLQADAKVLLGGEFTTLQPNGAAVATSRGRIARLNADGTLDLGFNPNANSAVLTVAAQVDGKVVLGGDFNALQPNGAASSTTRNCIARVNADGTLDASFNPNANSAVFGVAIQANAKVLLVGAFTTLQPSGATTMAIRKYIARVNADGSLDSGFDPNANNLVYSLAVQANGKVLLGGEFTGLQPNGAASMTLRGRIARVNADGTLDTIFNPNANGAIYSMAIQADGEVLLGGRFNVLSPNGASSSTRNHFARLANELVSNSLSAATASQLSWTRGGSSPELARVTFELSSDNGATWSALGAGARVGTSSNWQLTGLALPSNGKLRARGVTASGFGNASSGLVETVTNFPSSPEIALSGNMLNIVNGDATPSTSDHTDFGSQNIGNATTVRTFTISNSGTTDLILGAVSLVGPNAADFTLSLAPSPTVPAAGTTNFQVSFDPSTTGLRSASVSFANNDSDENPFNFNIQGVGTSSNNSDLSALTISAGELIPAFNASTTAYLLSLPNGTNRTTVTATSAEANAILQLQLNGGGFILLTSGAPSSELALNVGANTISVRVTSQDGSSVKTYTITLTRGAPTTGDLAPLEADIVGGGVLATAVQPNGKTILAGSFSSVLGVPRYNIARLNADGTLDLAFNPNPNDFVSSVAVQADGKVLIAGDFTALQPNGATLATGRRRIARVNADGTLDLGFDPNPNLRVYSVLVQADGKVLLGGDFTELKPNGADLATTRYGVARVNVDGSLDLGFDPNAEGASVYSLALQEDGKILLGGTFDRLQPNGATAATMRRRIARLNADGTLDLGFDPNANGLVHSVVLQADGKVLLGGFFNTLQPNGAAAPTMRNFFARLNADGSLDLSFDPFPDIDVTSIALQADGKVLLGGRFFALQPNGAASMTPRRGIARVNADGTLDTSFNPNANNLVYGVALQGDGRVLLGGAFTALQANGAAVATPRNLFAQLVNAPATQSLTAPTVNQVSWVRGGSAPELSRVSFELSTDGVIWTPLGAGQRVGTSSNWQLTGVALPASGRLRARGVTSGGYFNASSGLVQSVAILGNDILFSNGFED
jgi:uncharacterized delta-60 repeat protein